MQDEILKQFDKSLIPDLPEDYLFGHGRFFGTLYSPWLAEVAGCNDRDKIIDIGTASLDGRLFVILQDQVYDNDNLEFAALAPFFLAMFLRSFSKYVEQEYLLRIMQEYSMANLEEDQSEKETIIQKTGLIKVPAKAYSNITNKPNLAHAVGEILYGIQICDDIADMDEDDFPTPPKKMGIESALKVAIFSFENALSYISSETQLGNYLHNLIRHLGNYNDDRSYVDPANLKPADIE